ncbi:Pyrimidine monooxygenase RutA [Sinobacterium norvegicum]|uniref:Pyrimidine monooxygenase RutA n=1 Tax=Sinobacterium norvegicum TaxID=1641715 RepID=A0ABN8EGR5_9GAMM|nr:LLM class flavin-dependent oxidoreductase [Sinobacterium norvegicum]CAH0990067.1 Pyrimidine monooxygenase RutA [Sinobacterium norvegicum]
MKISLCLPYMEKELDRSRILQWCKRADEGPFHAISCGERITGYTLEMRNMLAFAAAATERVRIVPSLYVLPMHNAVWAAKEIATLDVLSGGRVSVVVGVGGREADYNTVGASFTRRHQRMDQQIAEMRSIWQSGYHDSEQDGRVEVGPTPVQQHIPILAGVMGEKPMARAAEWADGVYAFAMDGDASLTRHFKRMAEQKWQQAGRQQSPYFAGGFWFSLVPGSEQILQNYVYHYLLTFGEEQAKQTAQSMTRHSNEAVAIAVEALAEVGCDELFMVPASAEVAELEQLQTLLQRAGIA